MKLTDAEARVLDLAGADGVIRCTPDGNWWVQHIHRERALRTDACLALLAKGYLVLQSSGRDAVYRVRTVGVD